MVIFSQRWDGNDFFWGYHCYRWFFDGFDTTEPSPLNVFFTDWPLTSMVFQWFSTNSGTMVNDGFGLFKRPKKLKIARDPILGQTHLINRERLWMKSSDHFRGPRPFYRLKTKSTLSGPHFATIAKFQWFSKAPFPLNGMVRVKPLGSMVFRWFWCQATIGFNGFQWLSGIGPTVEWLHTIVEV